MPIACTGFYYRVSSGSDLSVNAFRYVDEQYFCTSGTWSFYNDLDGYLFESAINSFSRKYDLVEVSDVSDSFCESGYVVDYLEYLSYNNFYLNSYYYDDLHFTCGSLGSYSHSETTLTSSGNDFDRYRRHVYYDLGVIYEIWKIEYFWNPNGGYREGVKSVDANHSVRRTDPRIFTDCCLLAECQPDKYIYKES